MVTIPGGGDGLPEPLTDRHFAGEVEGDFEQALAAVRAGGARAQPAPSTLWAAFRRMLDGRTRAAASGQLRRVGFDGFHTGMHDEKTERDRRYGTVYTVTEYDSAYLVRIEMPRRIPASSLKEIWNLPDEMPDYDYDLALRGNVLAIRAGVRGDALRRLSYISSSFPADVLTRIELSTPVDTFKHRLRDKILQVLVFKAEPRVPFAAV